MFTRVTVAAAVAAIALTAAAAAAQDTKPQEKPKETTIVIKDDATPKAKKAAKATADATKKAAKATADAAKKAGNAVKDTDVKVKDDVPDTKVVIKDDTTPQVKKGARVVADGEITAAVKTKLLGDKAVGGRKIDVDTEKGVVTLTGTVTSAAEKAEAIRLAKTTAGVHSVVDKLTIQ
jgi:osmotically-inducible protein OsmY